MTISCGATGFVAGAKLAAFTMPSGFRKTSVAGLAGAVVDRLQSGQYGVEVSLTHAQQHCPLAPSQYWSPSPGVKLPLPCTLELPAGGQIFHRVSVRVEAQVADVRALAGRIRGAIVSVRQAAGPGWSTPSCRPPGLPESRSPWKARWRRMSRRRGQQQIVSAGRSAHQQVAIRRDKERLGPADQLVGAAAPKLMLPVVPERE